MTAAELLTPIVWVGIIQLAAWEAGERLLAALTRTPGAAASAPCARPSRACSVWSPSRMRCCCSRSCTCSTPRSWSLAVLRARRARGRAGSRGSGPCAGCDSRSRICRSRSRSLFLLAHLPNALYPVLDHDDNVYHLELPTTLSRVARVGCARLRLVRGDAAPDRGPVRRSRSRWAISSLARCSPSRSTSGSWPGSAPSRCRGSAGSASGWAPSCTCPVRTSSGTSAAPTTSRSSASSCSARRWRSSRGGRRGAGPISPSSASPAAPPARPSTRPGCSPP